MLKTKNGKIYLFPVLFDTLTVLATDSEPRTTFVDREVVPLSEVQEQPVKKGSCNNGNAKAICVVERRICHNHDARDLLTIDNRGALTVWSIGYIRSSTSCENVALDVIK